MSLLGILDLAAVVTHLLRKVLLAETLFDQFPSRSLGLVREHGRVGAHVGNEAVLVQLLSEAHRVPRLEPQLAVRVLLQAACHVGRLRRCRERLPLDRDDRGFRLSHFRFDAFRGVPVQLHPLALNLLRRPLELACIRVEVLGRDHALALHLHQVRFKLLTALGETGLHPPVARLLEADPGALALDQQAHGHALHASGAQPREHLLPEQGAHFVAEEPVDDAAGLLGLDQVVVDRARAFQRLVDCVAGDLVEDEPLERHFRPQQRQEVPADGFAFAILVRCEVNVLRLLDRRLHLADEFLLVLRNDVERLEVRVHVDARARPRLLLVLGRDVRGVVGQVAHVAHRRLHDEVLGQERLDRPRLGGRLDDHERTLCRFASHRASFFLYHSTGARATERPASANLSRRPLGLAMRADHVNVDRMAHAAYGDRLGLDRIPVGNFPLVARDARTGPQFG